MKESILTCLPADVIYQHFLPYLDANSLIHFACSSKNNYEQIVLTNNGMASNAWKTLFQSRWKRHLSIQPKKGDIGRERGHCSRNTDAIQERKGNHWYKEYARRHCQDSQVLTKIRKLLVLQRDSEETDSIKRSLLRSGPDIHDRLIELSTSLSDHNHSNEWWHASCAIEDREKIENMAQELLVSSNRMEAFLNFQHLFEESLGNNEDVSQEVNCKSSTSMETGAIIIATIYENASELRTFPPLKDRLENELNSMAEHLLTRLKERSKNMTLEKENYPHGFPVLMILEEMRRTFFASESNRCGGHFRGNEQDYYNYQNSLLDRVIQNRIGIPMTLSILFASIVRRATNLLLEPIGLPGKFLLSVSVPAADSNNLTRENIHKRIFIDAFDGGRILEVSDCMSIVSNYRIAWNDSLVKPVSYVKVWSRMLRNLLTCHEMSMNDVGVSEEKIEHHERMGQIILLLSELASQKSSFEELLPYREVFSFQFFV